MYFKSYSSSVVQQCYFSMYISRVKCISKDFLLCTVQKTPNSAKYRFLSKKTAIFCPPKTNFPRKRKKIQISLHKKKKKILFISRIRPHLWDKSSNYWAQFLSRSLVQDCNYPIGKRESLEARKENGVQHVLCYRISYMLITVNR